LTGQTGHLCFLIAGFQIHRSKTMSKRVMAIASFYLLRFKAWQVKEMIVPVAYLAFNCIYLSQPM
jgi:hypothetical protein